MFSHSGSLWYDVRGVSKIEVGSVLQEGVINFQRIRQGQRRHTEFFDCRLVIYRLMVANCTREQILLSTITLLLKML